MRSRHGFSIVELMVTFGVMAMLASLLIVPAYLNYSKAHQAADAAAILAQDIAYLERFAQDSAPFEGATIEVQREEPFEYTCYSGRPSSLDPQSHIRGVLRARTFANVRLVPGALGRSSPLMFARNGSVQYVAGGIWVDQHVPVAIVLLSREDSSRPASVRLNPFTGAVSLP